MIHIQLEDTLCCPVSNTCSEQGYILSVFFKNNCVKLLAFKLIVSILRRFYIDRFNTVYSKMLVSFVIPLLQIIKVVMLRSAIQLEKPRHTYRKHAVDCLSSQSFLSLRYERFSRFFATGLMNNRHYTIVMNLTSELPEPKLLTYKTEGAK